MPFITQGKTNWKFLLIVVVLAAIVGGGILIYQYWWAPKQEVKNVACTQEAKLCPDGSYVGRIGPNCEFAECPIVKTDETADWKTYRNEEYGFEFKYPPYLRQFEWPGAVVTLVTPDYEIETSLGPKSGATLDGAKMKLDIFQIDVDPIIKEDFVTRRCEYLKIGSPKLECKQEIFLSLPAAEVIDRSGGAIREKTFFIEKDKKVYSLSVDVAYPFEEYQSFFYIFDKMLSTFRFLE